MGIEKGRRHGRVAIRLSATLVVGRREQPVVTADLSRGGVRLLTDDPPAERLLAKLRITLPGSATPETLEGVTVRRVPPGGDGPPGVSIQLYGNTVETVSRWERFVQSVPADDNGAAPMLAMATEAPPGPIRRRFGRIGMVLEVHVQRLDDLLPLASRDVSRGGMFLRSDTVADVGEELGLDILHPDRNESFPARCVVRRVVNERGMGMGMGVEFLDLDAARRDALWAFIVGDIPELDDGAVELLDDRFIEIEDDVED